MRATIIRLLVFMLLPLQFGARGQQKRPLTHADSDSWNRISGEVISGDGLWVAYGLGPLDGDSRVVILNRTTGKADTILRASSPRLTRDSRFALVTIRPPAETTKREKIAKKKGEEQSKDSVGIIELGKPGMAMIPRTKSYQLPEKGAGWVAIHLEKDPPAKDSTRAKKRDGLDAEEGGDTAPKAEKGTTLVARELATGFEFRFPLVSEFTFSKNGQSLLIATTDGDSASPASVLRLDTGTRVVDTLIRGKGKYRQLSLDAGGSQGAFLADRDTSKAKQRVHVLHYWKNGSGTIPLADTATRGLPAGWMVSENGNLTFSENGTRLFLGTAPIPIPDDTTFNDVETARLDVWSWTDGYLQSHQLKDLENEKKRTYRGVVHLAERTFVQLADTLVPDLLISDEGNGTYAVGTSDIPYRKNLSWENDAPEDVYIVNVVTGKRLLILPRHKGRVALSPGGGYVTWYDVRERHWYAIDAATGARVKLTAGVSVPLFDELNDVPDDPGSYGASGWIGKDSLFLVNDRYDIWATDPTGRRPATSFTRGLGRKALIQFRTMNLDPESRWFEPDSVLLLSAFHTGTKEGGIYRVRARGDSVPERLLLTPHRYMGVAKARLSNGVILRRSDVSSQELYASTTDWTGLTRLTDCNPQQAGILWPSVELVSWKASTGRKVEGLLYKPENFDPAKKYPMLVYYYERNSDLLHTYTIPAHSASTINRSYCASNGYLVFIPDIHYRTGHPGKSAMECVIPGVRALIRKGYVDSARIALQGQSWGGYQTAYIVTQTPMFRCAFAGAPVANMTSAYGGIRWESGRVREMQYEKAQSRIGATLWDRLDLYIENSPLFHLTRVTTPLLIMSNDNDGAVPWYQGIELFTALRRLNKPAWMLVYNNEAHNLVQTRNRKDLSIRMMQFFDHYLKGAPLPVWMREGVPAIMKTKTLGTGLLPETGR